MTKEDEILAEDMARFFDDPLGFVMYAFDWEKNEALKVVELKKPWSDRYKCKHGLDEYACRFLEKIGDAVKKNKFDGKTAVDAIRAAITSGHGIGKSTLTSWLILWVMSTRPFSIGTVTANTSPQLQTKTWAQLAKWKSICITGHWFKITTGKGSMKLWHVDYKDSWFCSGQTCKEENSESFAGQHAANATSFYIFDEASAVPNIINEVSEGGLTDGEPMKFAFGNPTRNSGWFFEAFHKQKHRWITEKVDSRTVQITNKKIIDEWIKDHGIDSDFVKVRVLGEFPSQSVNQLISRDLVESAFKREYARHQIDFAPVVLGVDVAWEGDDRSCIYLRQGLHSKCLGVYRQIDTARLGGLVNQFWNEYKADACFIDMGWGSGVIDYLRNIGKTPVVVNFGSSSLNPEYYLKRTEMWCELKKWLESGGQLQENDDLLDDLTSPELYFRNDGKKFLEPKKSMKIRGLQSPDLADALALTFAAPVHKKDPYQNSRASNFAVTEYDPFK